MAAGSRKRVSIAPLTHTIESYRNARMTWAGCLAELVDNALSPEKGNASSVRIAIAPNEVRVHDDGVGIDDVSRVVRPGDSGTWGRSSDIGLYGIGATQALLWLGRRSEVHTIRGGQYSRATVDWDALLRRRRSDSWDATIEDLGHVELLPLDQLPAELRKLKQGSLLVASRRVRGRRSPHARDIRRSLERLYTPALRSGRQIDLKASARTSATTLEPLAPPTLATPVKVAGEISGKGFRGEVGILQHADARISGIWFGYQHRMIVRKGAADIPGLPSNIYGYVELDPSWRRSLSTFKDDIVRDLDPLLEDVRAQISDVISQGLHWNKDLKVEWLKSQLTGVLFKRLGDNEGLVEVQDPEATDSPRRKSEKKNEKSDAGTSPKDSVPHGGEDARPHEDTSTGIRIESEPGRDPFVWTDVGDSGIVVSFDPTHPHFEASLAEPVDCPAFYGAIGASLASALSSLEPDQIAKLLPALRGKLGDSEKQRFATILDEFTKRTAAIRDRPTMSQIEADLHD